LQVLNYNETSGLSTFAEIQRIYITAIVLHAKNLPSMRHSIGLSVIFITPYRLVPVGKLANDDGLPHRITITVAEKVRMYLIRHIKIFFS
jgi:hypothetical protein